jgi:hypothetical protein
MTSHNNSRDLNGSDSLFASAVHLSGEGLYGPVISKEETQSDPVCPSGKDDAQISNTSGMLFSNLVVLIFFVLIYPIIATDTKSGMPNDSTYPTTDPPSQECISTLTNQVDDLKIRISHLESGRNSTHQTPMAVTNDDDSVQQDDNTNPLKHRSGVPLSSNPTTSSFRQKHLTARILIHIACLYILVVILLQTFYAHYTNLRDSRFWWSAAYDWCFATDACNTKVGTPLKEGYDAGLASISAFWGVVEMTWFHCLDTITPWGTWIHWVGHILLACCICMLTVRWPKNVGK